MNLIITLVALVAALGAAAGCGWMGARPKDYANPSLVPWQPLMLVCAFLVLVIGVHLINLLGVTTGQNQGR